MRRSPVRLRCSNSVVTATFRRGGPFGSRFVPISSSRHRRWPIGLVHLRRVSSGVEQLSCKQQVVSSNLTLGSRFRLSGQGGFTPQLLGRIDRRSSFYHRRITPVTIGACRGRSSGSRPSVSSVASGWCASTESTRRPRRSCLVSSGPLGAGGLLGTPRRSSRRRCGAVGARKCVVAVDRWLASKSDVSAKSRSQYEWAAKHIRDGLGGVPLEKLARAIDSDLVVGPAPDIAEKNRSNRLSPPAARLSEKRADRSTPRALDFVSCQPAGMSTGGERDGKLCHKAVGCSNVDHERVAP